MRLKTFSRNTDGFGAAQKEQKADKATVASIEPEGPILNPHERIDAVSSQDEVDDLLSSLGFRGNV